jgi:hypothetical protein
LDLRGLGGGGGLFSGGDDSLCDGEADFFWHRFLFLFAPVGEAGSML